MSIRSGFFNSTNHDRLYNAEDFSKIFDGIIRDGVFMSEGDHFNVTARTGMVVRVGTGRSWFLGTYTINDEPIDFTVPAAHATLNRIDAIVIDVDKTPAVRANNVLYLEGTPATDPVPPTFVSATSHKQYPLCYIQVNVGTASMSQALITNKIGLEPCPFVTGILDKIDITTLIAQWESQWSQWKNRTVTETDAWIALHKQGWVNDKAQFEQDYTDWLDTFEAAAESWYSTWQTSMTNLQTAANSWVSDFEDELDEWKDNQQAAFMEWWHELQEIASQLDGVGIMKMVEGYFGTTTSFPPDGSIRVDFTSGFLTGYYQITTFEANGDIWNKLYDSTNTCVVQKKTSFPANGNIVDTVYDGNYVEPTPARDEGHREELPLSSLFLTTEGVSDAMMKSSAAANKARGYATNDRYYITINRDGYSYADYCAAFSTESKIDLTGIDAIVLKGYIGSDPYDNGTISGLATLGFAKAKDATEIKNQIQFVFPDDIDKVSFTGKDTDNREIVLDTSDLSGEYYLHINLMASNYNDLEVKFNAVYAEYPGSEYLSRMLFKAKEVSDGWSGDNYFITGSSVQSGKIESSSGRIRLFCGKAHGDRKGAIEVMGTDDAVNLSDFKTLRLQCNSGAKNYITCYISKTKIDYDKEAATSFTIPTKNAVVKSGIATDKLDISKFDGNYYIILEARYDGTTDTEAEVIEIELMSI